MSYSEHTFKPDWYKPATVVRDGTVYGAGPVFSCTRKLCPRPQQQQPDILDEIQNRIDPNMIPYMGEFLRPQSSQYPLNTSQITDRLTDHTVRALESRDIGENMGQIESETERQSLINRTTNVVPMVVGRFRQNGHLNELTRTPLNDLGDVIGLMMATFPDDNHVVDMVEGIVQ